MGLPSSRGTQIEQGSFLSPLSQRPLQALGVNYPGIDEGTTGRGRGVGMLTRASLGSHNYGVLGAH